MGRVDGKTSQYEYVRTLGGCAVLCVFDEVVTSTM